MSTLADDLVELPDVGVTWTTEPRPWRRYGARFIDVQLLGGLMLLLLSVVLMLLGSYTLLDWLSGGSQFSGLLVGSLSWFFAAPMAAVLSSWTGTSPGKLLFGLRVRSADGLRLSFSQAAKREAFLLFWGVGFAIPIVSLMTLGRSLSVIEEEGRTRWDERAEAVVEARPIKGWQVFGVVFGTMVVVAVYAFEIYDRTSAMA